MPLYVRHRSFRLSARAFGTIGRPRFSFPRSARSPPFAGRSPSSSNNRTDASTRSCSPSSRESHHSPNSCVYSTGHFILYYASEGIYRQCLPRNISRAKTRTGIRVTPITVSNPDTWRTRTGPGISKQFDFPTESYFVGINSTEYAERGPFRLRLRVITESKSWAVSGGTKGMQEPSHPRRGDAESD